MVSIFRGKTLLLNIILLSLVTVVSLSAQSFSEPPPLLFNQLSDTNIVHLENNASLVNTGLEKKSVPTAFFLSLLLPGLGEAYLDKTGYTKVFMSVEALGWGLFIANEIQVASRVQDYKNYAVQHANVQRNGKNDQYWIDIGKYDNIYGYNEQRSRDRDIDALYPETMVNFWRWDATENRFNYDGMRINASQIEERQIYIVGGIILNHLVSAINALRLARAHNRQLAELSWKFDVGYNPRYAQLSLGISKSF